MTVSLGTLEIGLGLITTQYDTGIARAKGQLVSLQRMAARSGVTVKIGVKVDDRPLYQLNDHLKLKRDDLDKTSDHYRRNPIRVFVEDRQLVSLNQQLRELKRVSVDIKVPSRLVVEHRFSGYQDKVEKEIERSTSRLASEIRKSYSRGGIVGAASRLVTGVIALPFKATATVLRDVVRGYFERIGQEFSNTWAVEPSRNAARKITIAIKKIDRYLLGQNQVLETYLSELTRSGSTEKAFNAAFKRTNVNQVIERFKTLQEIATVPASKTKERLRLIQKDPELSKILKQSTEEIQKQYAGQGLSKAEIANLSMQRFLENAQPQTKVVNILNSFLKEISPFLRFVQGMKDYRTSLEAQKIYSERKAGFPKLKEGEDVVSVIGGAQFRGGQGGRKVAMSLEPLAPQKRFIPVENPETDTDLENERPAEKQFKAFISRNLPFLEGEEILNTLINAFRQISSSLDVFTPSTAAAQALANTMLAQEQGRKGNAVSYSLGGVDNIQYARTAQFMGVKDTQALAIAYPFVDITQSTPKNFTASMLTSDPLGFVKLLGIGNKTNQFMGIESTNPYGSANHHQKHLFKNIEFINKFFATINANIPDLSPGKISAIVEAGDKLYELIGSMNQIESVLSTGEFNTDLPFHRFLQGYDGQTTKSNVLDLVLEMMQDNFAIEAFKDVEGAEEFYAKLRNQFDKIASQFKEKFQASGVNLPENLARDFAGFLKYQEVAEGYNKSMTEFQTGKVSEKPSWWAGNLDPNTVKQRTGKLQTETIPWFRKEGSKFGSYQDALIEMFTLIDKVTKEYVSRGGNLSDETRQNLKFFPTETIPSEINAFLGKSFPTKNLPKEEIVRDLNLQFPEYTASTSNLTALQKIDYEAEKQRVTKLFRNRQAAILAYNKLITELTDEIVPSIDKIKAIGTGFPELGMHGSFAFLTDEFVYKTDIDPEGVNKKIATPNELETYKQLQGRLSPLLYKAVPDKAIVTERIQGKTLKEILTRIAQPFKKVQKQLADATLALDKVTKEGNEAEIERLNKEITSLEKTAQKEKTRFNKAATILYKQVGQLNSALQKMGVVHNDLAETNVFFSPQGIRAIDFGGSQVNPTAAQKIEDKKTVIDRMMGNNQYEGLMDKTAVAGAILSGFQSPLPIPEKRTVDPEKLKQTTPGQLIELGSTNPTLLQQYGEKITYPKTKPFSIPPKQEKVTTPKTEKLNPTVFLEQSLTRNTDRTITALNSIEQALNEIKKGILAKYASPLIDPWQNSTPDPWAKSNAELMRVFVDAINKVSSQKLLPPAPDDFGSSETDRGNSPLEKILEDISIKAQAGLKSALTTRLSTPDSSGEIQLLTGQENISELLNQVLIREVKEAGRILGNALKDASLDVVKFGQIVFTVLKAIERPVMAIPGVGLGKKALQVGGTAAIGASALHALPMGLDATIVNEMRSILAGAMSAGGREMIQAVATQMTQAFSGLPFGVGQQLTEAVMNLVTELTNGTISVLAQGGAVAGSALMAGEGVKKLLGAATSSVPKLIDKEEQQKIEGKTQKLLKAAKDKAGSLITTEITPYFDEKAFPVSSPIPANIKAINPKYYTVKQLRGLARDQGIDVPASGLGARKEEIWKSLIEKFNPDQLTRLLLTTKASDRTKLGKKELSGFQIETRKIPADFIETISSGIESITQQINTNKDIQSLKTLFSQLEKIKTGIALIRANPEFDTTSINKSLSGFVTSINNLLLNAKSQIQSKNILLPASTSNLQAENIPLPVTETPNPLKRVPQENSPTSPGFVGKLPISDLNLDPERFQYKLVHGKTGSTGSLSGVGKWDDDLAGVVSVWRDPEDGKVYVVNGHNRLNLAKDLNVKDITVRLLNAQSAQEARAKGAMINIAEGRGTAIDAAKFLRDMNLADKESLKKAGIPMRDRVASQGLALAQLPQELFDRVASGDISELRGVQIGGSGLKEFQQRELVKLIENFEKKGKKVTESVVSELIDTLNASTVDTVEQFDLFGSSTTQQTDVLTRAEVQSALRNRIATDKRVFGSLTSDKKAAKLKTAGNQINTEENKAIAEQAEQALRVFDQLKNTASPVSSIINEAITLIKEQGMTAKAATDAVYDKLKQIVPQLAKGGLESGKNLSEGLTKGLKDNDAEKIVRKNARNIIDGLNDELGNRSPSWKGEKAGRYLIQGVGIGIEKEESRLTTKIKELTTKVIKELQSGMPVNAQQFIQTESFKGVTINPATTGSANKPIENNWEKTEKSVRENIQEIATEAKKHSKDIQRGLSEASPGPTWNIRKNWRVTAEYVSVQIRQIAQEAEQAKARIDKAGLAGFTFKPFTPSLPKASPPLPLLLPSSPAPSIRTERENQRQQRISAPAPSNRIIPAFGASPYSFGEYLASLVQKAEQAIYRQTLSGGGGGNQPPKPPRIASPASPEPEPPKREKFDVSKEAERVLEDIQKARAILQKQESLLNQTLKAAKPQKSTREKILEDWNQKRDNIFKALDSVEKAGVSSGFTDGIVTGLKTAIAQADGFINFLSVGGKALRTLDKELDAATGGMINLRKASLAVIGGFALFKTAEFLLEPLFFAIQDLPFRVQQAVTDSLLAFTELQQIRINLDIAGVNNVDTAIDGLRNRADELGISFRESTKQYAQFQIVTTGSPLQAQGDDIFEGFQSALAVRQTNPQQQTETFRAINQMAARSVLSVEEFTQQLTESGGLYDALIVAARAMGMTTAEFYQQASAGQLLSQDVIPRLAAEYERLSAGGIGASSKTLQAEMNRYQNNIEQLSMSTGEKLGGVAYPSLQLLNTLLKGLNDNLGLVATVGASAVISAIGFLGKTVLQFSAATRLGQFLISSYNASLFAMGVAAGQTTTKMQMLSATAKVAGGVLKATIGAMIVPAATIVALQTFYDIFERGDANLKNSLQTLKESRKVLENLGKIEPENKNKNLWNKFYPDMNLSGTEKFFNVLTLGQVYSNKRSNAVFGQLENLKNIRKSAEGLETNLKTYQTVLSDTAGIDKFIDSLQGLRNSLAQVRAERAIAANKEDFAAVARLNEREQELMKQEQETIDRRLGSVGSRITADLQVAEAALAAYEEEYQKSGGTLKHYGATLERFKGIIAGLKAEQQNYLNVLRDQEKEYKKLQYAFNRTLNAQENRNFINARQSLNRQIGNELAFASGQLNEYEFNVKVREESLQTAKEKFASLQTTASETGAKLSSRITEAADKTLSTYFKDDLKRLGVGNFSEAIARNLLSPEAIERVMSENSGDLESNAALKNILEMAKTYATTRQEILQSEKEIQSINREIITERKRRQLSEKQAANEILIAGQQEKLYSSTPTGKLRSLQPAETRVSLEELYKQLAVEQERLAANVDDPLQIRSNIARIKTNIARTRLTLRDQQNDLVEFYTTTAIEIEATNKQIGLTARTASNQVKTFARDQTLIEISKLYKQLAFEQSKLVGTLKGDPLEVKANIARIQLQIEQAKLSLRDQTTDIEDYYTGLQRQVVDLRVSIEDYQIQSAREVRGFKEAYGDMIRGLQRSLIEAENEFRASQRSLENQRLQVSMLSGRTPGVSSLQKQLDDLILQYRDEIASIQGEADSLRTRPLDIRDQSIQFARQLRDIQEQIYDAERNRLKQLRDFWMQQVQIVRELSQQQLTFKSLNEIWAGILENSKKLLAKSGKIAGGKVPNVALAIGEAPNNSESSEQYRQGTSNNPRTLQRGDYIDYGNGRIYKYDPSPNYDPKTMRYRSPVNADEIRHPSVVQQVGTSGSEEFDRLLMRSGLYKNWEGFTREVLNPNLQPLTPEERANYNAGNVGRYSGVLTGQPQANIPLTPLPTFDYDRARELDTQIRITREKTLQNQKEENLLKLERARRENLDRIAGLIQQTQEARIQAEIGLRDTGDTSTDLMRSSKGYLTFSEKIEQARRNGSREIEKQRESIQSQIRSLDQLTSDFAKNSEETRARLFQDTGNDDAFKALEAENKRNTAILEGYKALDNQLSVYGQIRGEAAAMRMIEDERVAALERYNNLIADGIDAGNRMNPLGTLFSAGEAQKLRIEADFARRRLELQRYAQEGALSPTQLFEMSSALDKMQQANLASAFIEANPAVGAFGDLLRSAFTGGRDTLQQMLNVLTSFLQKIGEMAANQLLMQIFGGSGRASSPVPSGGGGGGLLGGAISLFTGSLGGFSSPIASTPFTGASNFSLGTGFSLFSSGGKIGADAPIEKNVISAFRRERSMSGGRNPRLIVANEDEYVIPANEAKSYLEYKNAPIKNYASGGFVGGTGYSVTTSNNNSSNQSLSITNVSNVTIESRNDMGYSLTQLKERENAQNERTKRRFFG
jgi:tape measure domain-containing protein